MDAAEAAFEGAKGSFGHLVHGLKELDWSNVPQGAQKFIIDHPSLSGLPIVVVLLLFCPLLVASPALWALGFGSAGPVAGSYAAIFQAAYGTPAFFSVLQSAAMGGYGVALISAAGLKVGIVTGAAALTGWAKGKL